MSNYQLHLLLEALVQVHSLQELSDGSKAIARLVRHLRVSWDEAEAIVEGALHLKQARRRSGVRSGYRTYVQ